MSFLIIRSVFRRPSFALLISIAAFALLFISWGSADRRHAYSAGSVLLNGRVLNYQADAGYITVNPEQNAAANIFYTAYTAGYDNTNRPLTFIFNGGPGSASIWLHMGAGSPVRTVPGKAGYGANPDTWLGFTDLVFIDPVGTGFSRPVNGVDARHFYGYQADIRTIGTFIQFYLHRHHRQNSRVFLAGESYGAARAVGLAAYLQDSLQTKISGLTLISPALDYKLISFRKGNNEPYPYYLSAYAIAAQYHHQLAPELAALSADELSAKVSAFAFGTYRQALSRDGAIAQQVIDTLSYFTGLSKEQLKANNGRITDVEFTSSLLKQSDEKLGTFDSRSAGASNAGDPSAAALSATFEQAFQQYVHKDLHFNATSTYLATIPTPVWNYGQHTKNGYFNVTGVLKNLLSENPDLRVQIVSGSYDLATPPATVSAALAEAGINGNNTQVSVNHYAAGHMVYTDTQVNHQFKQDSENFYR
ncbi:carboxypeptidase C (cathepsin A) [Mucilaginibacter yixingensis]|uniref:Carboxypeptidase C (Cathepsin A) n=1 Tax=Mucilaginibacter yixingensis TaxID=1295612 RepID=A0A2T5JGW5_9SPHI|nr:hypothetical protein [Mucilaginibacter yixingensis]PTR01675.1 carboxypeptidase C (cathepsin A) [Mucilaginibacter yixingensis]